MQQQQQPGGGIEAAVRLTAGEGRAGGGEALFATSTNSNSYGHGDDAPAPHPPSLEGQEEDDHSSQKRKKKRGAKTSRYIGEWLVDKTTGPPSLSLIYGSYIAMHDDELTGWVSPTAPPRLLPARLYV